MDPRSGLLALTVLLALFAGACLGNGNGVEVVPPEVESTVDTQAVTASTTTPADAVVTTTTVLEGPVAPFTGLLAASESAAAASAVVVKIGNNNDQSRPQAGLTEADIVYEELIEGLKTRFAAVFQSEVPLVAGPVRSARTTDVELLAGLGTPAFVFSGANTPTLAELREAANRGVFVDAGALRRLDPYFRLGSRNAPYNLWVDLEMIDYAGSGVPSAVLSYGELPEGMGNEIGGVEITYQASFGRQVTHLWDPAVGGWVRVQDGSLHTALRGDEEVEIAPANVVVLHVIYEVSPADPASPEAQSFDGGPVQVFTRGRVVEGTWTRSQQDPVWNLTDHNGEVISLQAGSTWFILAAADGSRFPAAHIATFDPAEATARLNTARG
ncbi:MAG: DUF3048 domain-containing protein [Acidimicrobiaceae bacterium]|nr:DUF3048 domain-containing protein [Acidimicrobiaceae bacterium]MYD06113.1 DUF3048 domain-containing protein [Acidimicrobiaceae bacterium]MYI57272.1 DUF3048 domain-containing protein [Acidimicrobiaceae bacterium]